MEKLVQKLKERLFPEPVEVESPEKSVNDPLDLEFASPTSLVEDDNVESGGFLGNGAADLSDLIDDPKPDFIESAEPSPEKSPVKGEQESEDGDVIDIDNEDELEKRGLRKI